jgi:excisionase family DNA binding protein
MAMLTTEQASERLGVTPARVRVLIREGRLPAQSFGRAHMINEDDLKLVADRKPGRPRKGGTRGPTKQADAKKAKGK